MSSRMDTVLREALDDMATSAPVPDGLARAALGRARRQRLGRAGLVGGAAVACAAAIAAGVVAAPTDPPPPELAVAGDIRTIVAFGGLMDQITPLPSNTRPPELVRPGKREGRPYDRPAAYSLLLNPSTGRYERMPYRRILPSPDGGRALVWPQDSTRIGVWERRTGAVRWFESAGDYGDSGEWSADGERILFMTTPANGEPAMVLADPDTMATATVRLANPTAGAECIFMELAWIPGGEGVAESAHCKQSGQWQASGIRTYDLAGKLTGTLPATAALAPGFAYSPDGALILLREQDGKGVIVVDAATGAERSRLPLPLAGSAPTGGGIVGWWDERHLAVYSVTGESGDRPRATLRVVDLAGATTHTAAVPYHPGEKVFGTVGR
jgi:hypothetical protein